MKPADPTPISPPSINIKIPSTLLNPWKGGITSAHNKCGCSHPTVSQASGGATPMKPLDLPLLGVLSSICPPKPPKGLARFESFLQPPSFYLLASKEAFPECYYHLARTKPFQGNFKET